MSAAALLVRGAREALSGAVSVPGDKSVSHRALLLGAIACGETTVSGLLHAEDIASTATCLRALGVAIGALDAPVVSVRGVGLRGLRRPAHDLDCGNSGTTMRLLLGILAGQDFSVTLSGDESLSRRPMDRVARPVGEMGAEVSGRTERCLPPVTVRGGSLRGIRYETPVASAQVKSAVLLAGLYAAGATSVTEPYQSRDHTERMLGAFGAKLAREGLTTTVHCGELDGCAVAVPGDISAAAFLLAAGLLVEGSEVSIEDVGVNPTRTGALEALREMGADVTESAEEIRGGEPVAKLTVRGSRLRGCEIGAELVPRLIDELPVLCVAAAVAQGVTRISGAQELRVKESDRLEAMATELGKMGARIEERPDGFEIEGVRRLRGAEVSGRDDHRVAMALAVAGAAAAGETAIAEAGGIATSFPGFVTAMRRIGVDVRAA
ncbi:MAG: 3-phosphoshikimate 1-carboxyvinyltransferase [Armatimonadota bacterium]|nr:MAG: 3-phosphoshikimate 1-carboxyvinyltransferase [Armatimonadota bacterium]